MGLSQLLAVSRSVRTIKDGPARYKMTQQNLLPRFGGEKPEMTMADPAAAVPAPAPAAVPVPVPAPVPASVAPVVSAVIPAAGSVAEANGSNGSNGSNDGADVSAWRAARLARPTKAAAFASATKKLRPFGDMTIFRNLFRRLLVRESKDAPMQAELLLELVKPIRNDLSDATANVGRRVEPSLEPLVTAPATVAETATAPVLEAAVPAAGLVPQAGAGILGRVKRRWLAAVFRTEKI